MRKQKNIINYGSFPSFFVSNWISKHLQEHGLQQGGAQPVRVALHLRDGDQIAYEIRNGHVILTKAQAATADDPFATFAEWGQENDRKAYADF